MIAPLKGLKKPKSMKRLSGLGRKHKQQPLPKLDSGPERIESLVDEELQKLSLQLGDERLAKRILKLRNKFYNVIEGTIPELIIMDYLDRKNAKYEFQKWILGGRALRGGQVVDFAIDAGMRVVVVEPQGGYWHTRPGNVAKDLAQRIALMGITIWGKKVVVCEVWERRLLDKHLRPQVLDAMMRGEELGK
jgi:hypothetical protein